MAIIFGMALVALSLFTPSSTHIDELGLYNPVYMFVQTGHMSYPVYNNYDAMVVHPPVHYLELAWLSKLGLRLPIAEAVPSLVLILSILWLVLCSRVPTAVQVGLLVATFVAITIDLPDKAFSLHSLRPDMQLALAWIAGLVSLESGRIQGWNIRRLTLGAFLVTYASTLHYFAWPAFSGMFVYMACAAIAGRHIALTRIPPMVTVCLAVLIPYAFAFMVPNWQAIGDITSSVQHGGTVAESLARHTSFYANTREVLLSGVREHLFSALLLLPVLSLQVPLVLLATTLLLIQPETRVLALAALPMPIFVLIYSQGKSAGYFVPELFLYVLGTISIGTRVVISLSRRLDVQAWLGGTQKALSVGAATLLCVAALMSTPALTTISQTWFLQPHPFEIARAAMQQVNGPGARVAGRIGLWYAAGGTVWREVESDVLWRNEHLAGLSPSTYLGLFDAIAEDGYLSNATANEEHASLASWYSDGTLKLRGFYFASRRPDNLSLVLLATSPSQTVEGYATDGVHTFRFLQGEGANYRFASLICPAGTTQNLSSGEAPLAFANSMLLPVQDQAVEQAELTTILASSDAREVWEQSSLATCRVRDMIVGSLSPVNGDDLMAVLHTTDRPIDFQRSPAELFETTSVTERISDTPGVVTLDVSAVSNLLRVQSIQAAINKAPDGSARGEWQSLGIQQASGNPARASFEWDTTSAWPGDHLFAVNLLLSDGSTLWWYDQPIHKLSVRQ